jgi:copper/silver efflux system protein
MLRIAVPMVGGMLSSTLLTLVVIPAIYAFVKLRTIPSGKEPATGRIKQPAE